MPLLYVLLSIAAFYSVLALTAYVAMIIIEATIRLISHLLVESMRMAATVANFLLTGLYRIVEAAILTIHQTGKLLFNLLVDISDYFFMNSNTTPSVINSNAPEPSAPAQEIDFNTVYMPSAEEPLYANASPLRFFSATSSITATLMTSDQIDFYESMMQRQF